MKKIILAILAISLLSGCAFRKMVTVDAKGKEIKTPAGKVKADIYYKSMLCLGSGSNECKEFTDN